MDTEKEALVTKDAAFHAEAQGVSQNEDQKVEGSINDSTIIQCCTWSHTELLPCWAEDTKEAKSMKPASSHLLQHWHEFTKKHCYAILAFWLFVICPLGFHCSPLLLASTSTLNTEQTSDGNPQSFETSFSLYALIEQGDHNTTSTLIDGESELYESTRAFISTLEPFLYDFSDQETKIPGNSFKLMSYYHLEAHGLTKLARYTMATPDGQAMIVQINFNIANGYKTEFLHGAMEFCMKHAPEGVLVSFTSFDLLEEAVLASIEQDSVFLHKIIAPIALIILALVLGNVPIVIMPFLTIVTSILGGAAIMYPISNFLSISQFTPLLMALTAVALSIDYCLFLISRCNEGIALGMKKDDAVAAMMAQSGHTILISGGILCGCCLGLLILPVDQLANVGIGLAVTIIMTLLVSMSLIPSLLQTKLGDCLLRPYNLIKAEGSNSNVTQSWTKMIPRVRTQADADDTTNIFQDDKNTDADLCHHEIEKLRKSSWYGLGKILVNPWKGPLIFLAATAIVLPVARYIPQTAYSMAAELQIPASSESLHTLQAIRDKFGFGSVYMTRIEFDGTASGTHINTKESFVAINKVLDELTGDEFPETPTHESYAAITTLGGIDVPFSFYEEAIRCGIDCPNEAAKTIAVLAQDHFIIDSFSTRVYVKMNVDPLSHEGIGWLSRARRKVEHLSTFGRVHNLRVTFKGPAEIYDAVDSVRSSFGSMVILTLGIVYVLMALFFRSAMIPILSILSIVLTQGLVYGLAVLIYQRGALNALGLKGLSSTGEIHWVPPVITFTIVVGLGIDYDVFLINRVLEYCNDGYTLNSSVIMGLYKTRGVISAAGVIMAVTMGGLLGSDIAFLNQISFLFAASVLMDTFVVRTVLLPILLCCCGRLIWWPMKPPLATKDILSA